MPPAPVLLPCSPPAARGACGPRSQQMALFGSAVPESLGITSRLCRPNQMTRLGAPRLLPAPPA